MRRILIAIGTTLTGLTLLLSWPTSLNRSVATTDAPAEPGAATTSGAVDTTDQPAPTPTTETYDGTTVTTRYGPVQVRVTVADGVVTAADAIQVPTSHHEDARINGYAVPILNSEAVAAQSADIAMVTGATYTSDGYITSLQSALDQAGL